VIDLGFVWSIDGWNMKVLALAVLLTISQASVPVPRQTADQAAGGNNNVKNKTGNQQTPSGLTLTINKQATGDNQDKRNNHPAATHKKPSSSASGPRADERSVG